MKKLIKKLWLTAILGTAGVLAVSAQTNAANLDDAIQQASRYITQNITSPKVALLSINSPSEDLTAYIIRELNADMKKNKMPVLIEKQVIDRTLSTQNLKATSEIPDSSARQIGKSIGADFAVTGSLVKAGDNYRLRIRLLNVSSTQIQTSADFVIRDSQKIVQLLGLAPVATPATAPAVAPASTPAAAPKPAPAPAVTPSPASTTATYKVGDKGPAGGWIFYDKGVFTSGWQYMEAAPNDIGPAQWGVRNVEVGGTSTAVGTGRANTQRIISELEQSGEDGAALLCTAMNINGLTGWFLPSKDELNLMYVNLKTKGLGGFGSGLYWSSSQAFSGGFLNLDRNKAFAQNFRNGSEERYEKNGTSSVRPVRQF